MLTTCHRSKSKIPAWPKQTVKRTETREKNNQNNWRHSEVKVKDLSVCCVYLRQIPKQNEISNAYTQGILHTRRTQAIHEEPAVRITKEWTRERREMYLPLYQCTLITYIIYHTCICTYDMYKYWCCACDICENYANLLKNVLHAKCELISPSEIAFPSTFRALFLHSQCAH